MPSAIVHYWLMNMRGGEKVLESLCRILPDADIFTLFYDPEKVSPFIRSRHVTASFLNPLKRYYRSLLPAMPSALERFDLRDYDLVISSESGPAKGVLTRADTRHICYCHTPMRYLWEQYPAYIHDWSTSFVQRSVLSVMGVHLRMWDYATSVRVDDFVANSRAVQKRIWRAYRRTSQVINPPVAVESFHWEPAEDYFLVVSELVPYKRVTDAVRCCTRTGRRLKIVGDGPGYSALKRQAGSSVEFCGRVSDEQLRTLYARCRALLLPGEEDFGIVVVEAMASGKPVIALGRGGVLDSVPADDPFAGVLYETPGEDALELALEKFECIESRVSPRTLQDRAAVFSEARFAYQMRTLINEPTTSRAANELVARGAQD